MKVTTRELMLLGNPRHPDFGVYAKFVTDMGESVHIQDISYCCDTCSNLGVVILDENDPFKKQVCMYCRGYKNGKEVGTIKTEIKEVEKIVEVKVPFEPKSLQEFYQNHEHVFGNGKNNPCKTCGVFKAVALIVTNESV